FFGEAALTTGTGGTNPGGGYPVVNEADSIPVTPGPYTITVAGSANWLSDLGVVYTATGQPLQQVASGPTQGQYSVAAGVYTFAAADQGLAVLISYRQKVTSGKLLKIQSHVQGYGPFFEM